MINKIVFKRLCLDSFNLLYLHQKFPYRFMEFVAKFQTSLKSFLTQDDLMFNRNTKIVLNILKVYLNQGKIKNNIPTFLDES